MASCQNSKNRHGDNLVRKNLTQDKYSGASNLAFNEAIKQLQKSGKEIYHFGFGQSPFPLMESAVDALKQFASVNAYLEVQGLEELRKSICSFHEKFDHVTVKPEDVVVGPGSKELIFLLMNVFSGKILILSPSWTTYKPQAIFSHHSPVIVNVGPETEWRLTPDILEKTLLSHQLTDSPNLLIFTNPCNPTGTTYTEHQLVDLSATFRKYGVIVLSDEIYARLNYTNDHISLVKIYPEGTILSTGLSKWASAGGWRIGYSIYPNELSALKRVVKSACSHTFSCAPSPMQYAAIQVLANDEECADYINHTRRIMSTVAEFCYRELTAIGVKSVKPKAGYYMFPDFEIIRKILQQQGITSCEEMCQRLLEEASVALMSGGPSFLRPLDELTTRLCYVNFDGSDALTESRRLSLEMSLPPTFVRDHCRPVFDGIMALKGWVEDLLIKQGHQ